MLALNNIIAALEKNEMLGHTRTELETAFETGYARAKEYLGELQGMCLAWQPDNESFNKQIEDFLGDGGNYEHVAAGMRTMSAELKRKERNTNPPQSDGGGLSDEAHTAMKDRQREVLGHSKYHPLGGRHGSQGA